MGTNRIATVNIVRMAGGLLAPDVMAGIVADLQAANDDPDISGIVVTGVEDTFCGGLDLAGIRSGGNPVAYAASLSALLKLFPRLRKPTVAAVNGDALASGAAIVATVDYAVVTPSARIGSYEVAVGVWPMVAQVPLIKRLGARRAMENIGSGEPFSAQRALEVGLVNQVVESTALRGAAEAWLGLAARGGEANAGRATFYELAELSYDDALDAALDKFAAQFRRPEVDGAR